LIGVVITDDVKFNKPDIHIAIIPDGNRRWARKRNQPEWCGHMAGANKLEKVLDWCLEHPEIKMISVYALSTENLSRSKQELNKLWWVYKQNLQKILNSKKIRKNNVRVNVIGNSNIWRSDVRQTAKDVEKATEDYAKIIWNILLAYGSQFEILSAIKKVVKTGVKAVPPLRDAFVKHLMINRPVDLIIRTGGQYRLSNFLLYQSAYSEIYFSPTLWPEFSRKEFEKILRWFWSQRRKFGK
jgi:tritrans,polycis-undecaprenyl-diphosphate synthase [geranylgeranyl-diphosphate specific]